MPAPREHVKSGPSAPPRDEGDGNYRDEEQHSESSPYDDSAADYEPSQGSYSEAQTQDDALASPCSAKTGSEPYFPQMPPASSSQPSGLSYVHVQQGEPASSSDARTGSEHPTAGHNLRTIWESNKVRQFRGDRPMHPDRINIQTRQKEKRWDPLRGQPEFLYTQYTADAIHLCLYACHTVLQPIFDQRHSGENRIKTCTAEGMQKWVQNNFHWLRDIYREM